MGFIEKQGLRFYQFDLFAGYPLFHAVLTRHGGFSQKPFDQLNAGGTVGDNPEAVIRNHKKIYEVFGYDYYSRFDVWQVHGTKIICADEARGAGEPHVKADGILTANEDLTLFMRFADCVPILLYDPIQNVIGIIHAGWQGTAKKIGVNAVEKMAKCFGSHPRDILAGIGPSICQDCYEVGENVYEQFCYYFGAEADNFFKNVNQRRSLDLWEANEYTLREAGVEKIDFSRLCTACNLEDWYSHRAEKGRTGRFGVLMSLRS